jgi:glutathione S-transferase
MKHQSFILISHDLCPYVQRSIITLEEKNISFTRTDIDITNKPEWFKQKSPMGKVPILLVDENEALFESAIICEYLDEITPGSLHPIDSFEKAFHRAWIEFGSSILSKIASLYNTKEASQFHILHAEIQHKFRIVESKLNGLPFFSGEKFHLIDAVYGPIFRYFDVFDTFNTFNTLNTFDGLPKCSQWRNALKQRKSVQNAVSKDYSKLLLMFLINRGSYLSQLISIERS